MICVLENNIFSGTFYGFYGGFGSTPPSPRRVRPYTYTYPVQATPTANSAADSAKWSALQYYGLLRLGIKVLYVPPPPGAAWGRGAPLRAGGTSS